MTQDLATATPADLGALFPLLPTSMRSDPAALRRQLIEWLLVLDQQLTARPRDVGGLSPVQALRLERYIEANLAAPMTVCELARVVRFGVGRFRDSCRRTFGVTPHVLVTRKRIEQAKNLIAESDVALAEVSLRCGFADQAHLCRRFKQHVGATPMEWRRAHHPLN